LGRAAAQALCRGASTPEFGRRIAILLIFVKIDHKHMLAPMPFPRDHELIADPLGEDLRATAGAPERHAYGGLSR
jgi:hypothetical protein